MNRFTRSRRWADALAIAAAAACLVGGLTTTASAVDTASSCEARVEELTGKYFKCVQNAEAKYTRRADAARLAKDQQGCRDGFDRVMDRVTARAGGACPSGLSPEEYRDFLDGCSTGVTMAAETGEAPRCDDCGNGVADLDEQCDGVDLAGASCASLGYSIGGELSCSTFCTFDLSGCRSQRASVTGNDVPYGSESDGATQLGAPFSFIDNGDGTITDLNTGLMWEKKDDSGGVHDKDNSYEWSSFSTSLNGTVRSDFLDALNDVAGGGANCFASHCDWRLPDIKELASILDIGRLPAIHPLFSQPTCTGCADVTQASCSCNVDWYMSSTTYVNDDYEIYTAHFDYGSFGRASKGSRLGARAVRNQ